MQISTACSVDIFLTQKLTCYEITNKSRNFWLRLIEKHRKDRNAIEIYIFIGLLGRWVVRIWIRFVDIFSKIWIFF